MTEKTFFKWINRYAETTKELSWAGSKLTFEENMKHRSYWLVERSKARKKLRDFFRSIIDLDKVIS